MNFADKINALIHEKHSHVCVGLDTRLDLIPAFIQKKHRKKEGKTFYAAANALLEFNLGIIDKICDLVIAIRINPAYYHVFGSEGLHAMRETIKYAQKKKLMVIADLRHSLFGPAAESSAAAFLGMVNLFGELTTSFSTDAVIVSPAVGFDGVQPYLEKADHYNRGVFVLLHTGNLTAPQIQDLRLTSHVQESGIKLYEHLANLINQWSRNHIGESGFSSVGAVIDAVYPHSEAELRKLMPNTIFLITNYGQLSSVPHKIISLFNAKNEGAIICASQSVIYAYDNHNVDEREYANEARRVVQDLQIEIDEILSQKI